MQAAFHAAPHITAGTWSEWAGAAATAVAAFLAYFAILRDNRTRQELRDGQAKRVFVLSPVYLGPHLPADGSTPGHRFRLEIRNDSQDVITVTALAAGIDVWYPDGTTIRFAQNAGHIGRLVPGESRTAECVLLPVAHTHLAEVGTPTESLAEEADGSAEFIDASNTVWVIGPPGHHLQRETQRPMPWWKQKAIRV